MSRSFDILAPISRYRRTRTRVAALVRIDREAGLFAVHHDGYVEAHVHLKALLDAAERGWIATVRCGSATTAFVGAERLRRLLVSVVPSRARIVREADGWSVFVPGLPVAVDAASFDEAISEMIDALREYAEDWQERLLDAPNHRDRWALVQLIGLSDDEQLRDWIVDDTQRSS